ncbi:MAG: protein kinase domain-containing protein [Myxococcota bacterium]
MPACGHCGLEHAPGTLSCPSTGEPMLQPGLIGTRIDRYEMLGLLGCGGFGAVYRARHVHTEALVALKVLRRQLHADASMLDRLLREAKAAASVGSEHIIRVTDAGVVEGQAFLAMELLEGWDLKELVARQGPLSPVRSGLILLQVLEGLCAAHEKGIVHRDMKPANVFLLRKTNESGVERDFIKLLDFGISKMHQEGPLSSLTLPGMAMGTPAYMAPEQFGSAKDVDARADLYSVGVILYELFAHRLPFDAESYADLLVKVRTQPPPPLAQLAPTLPAPLVAVVERAMAREVTARFQTALEMGDALRVALQLPQRSAQTSRPLSYATPSPSPLSEESMLGRTAPPTPRPATTDFSDASLLARTAPPTPRPEVAPAPVIEALPVPPPDPALHQVAPPPIQAIPVPVAASPTSARPKPRRVGRWVVALLVGISCTSFLMHRSADSPRAETAAESAKESDLEAVVDPPPPVVERVKKPANEKIPEIWQRLPAAERRELDKVWREASTAERTKLEALWEALPADARRELRQELLAAPPEERRELLQELRQLDNELQKEL